MRKEGANQSHRDFGVRRAAVHQAPQWLVTHNVYYCVNHVHIDQNALAQLPQDGNLSNLNSIVVDSPADSYQPSTPTWYTLMKSCFIKVYHVGVLGVTDYWMWFEWHTMAVLICTVWLGYLMNQMWSSCCLLVTLLMGNHQVCQWHCHHL